MSCELIMTVEEMQDREKWLEMRRTGIGGSDAAVILGISKWKSPWDLWLEKTGQVEDEKTEDDEKKQDRLFFGSESEEMIAKRFTMKTGKKLRKCGMLRSNEHPFMVADVDRLVVGENAIVEIKTTSVYNKDEWADGNVPPQYIIQGLHYMAVGGYDRCYFACLIGGQELVIAPLERDDYEIEALIEAERHFWEQNVIAKELPNVDGSGACSEAISKHFKGGGEDAEDLEGDYDMLCRDITALKEDKKKLEQIIAEKENKLKVRMGNSEFGRSAKFNVYFKTNERAGFNAKQLEKDYPEIHAKYVTKSQYRPLYVRVSQARKDD